jgi:hypothetical protein
MASMGSRDLKVSPGTERLCLFSTDCLKGTGGQLRHYFIQYIMKNENNFILLIFVVFSQNKIVVASVRLMMKNVQTVDTCLHP